MNIIEQERIQEIIRYVTKIFVPIMILFTILGVLFSEERWIPMFFALSGLVSLAVNCGGELMIGKKSAIILSAIVTFIALLSIVILLMVL